jgi:predicted nucleotidyltransferase
MKGIGRSSALLLAAAVLLRGACVFAVEIEGPGERPSALTPALPALSPAQNGQLPRLDGSIVGLNAVLPQLAEAALPLKAAAEAKAATPAAQARAASPRAEILKTLAPENAGRVSDAQAKDLSAELMDGKGAASNTPVDLVAAPSLFPGPLFAKPSEARDYSRKTEPARPSAARAVGRLKDAILDRLSYAELWADHLHFYVVRNIVNKWGGYQRDRNEAKAQGVTPAVSSPRAFFGHMRVMGQTGRYYPLGFTPRDNENVMKEARASFRRYFDAPGIGQKEYDAFDRFMARALTYNAEKRAKSNFNKRLRDKMLEASLLPADQIAAFFDARVKDDTYIKDFQKDGSADAVLEQFRGLALQMLLEEPAKADGKVLGVLLIGSFANGGATPGSDFDVSIITENGSGARAKYFFDEFVARWGEKRQKQNTVTFHEHPLRPSRWLVDKIHDCNYLIISPDKVLVDVLQRKPGEAPSFVTSKELTVRGRIDRVLQYLAVETTMLFTRPAPPKK